MAEVFAKGVDGKIYLAGKLQARINSWSMSMDAPITDVTDFRSSGQEYEYDGLANFAGTLNGQTLVHGSSVGTTGDTVVTTQERQTLLEMFASTGTLAAVQVKLLESSKSMWWGNVKFTNFSKDAPAQGYQTFSGNWVQSTGRLKYATSTST